KNASKTISEFRKKNPKIDIPKAKEFTPAEELIYTQEFQTKPSAAFKKLFKETTGYDIEDFKTKVAAVEAFESSQRNSLIHQNFVATHHDYVPSPENGDRIRKWAEAHGEPEFTKESWEK